MGNPISGERVRGHALLKYRGLTRDSKRFKARLLYQCGPVECAPQHAQKWLPDGTRLKEEKEAQ
jgi:hypothetical protein